MQTVSPALLQTIKELQQLPSLNTFALAGAQIDKRMAIKQKMRHSHDNILNIEGSKSWHLASIYWRMKVRRLYATIGVEYPKL